MYDIIRKSNYNKEDKIILCGDFNVDSLKYENKRPVII